MKILSLDVEGFRSLKQVHWEPGQLSVIIGPGNSGKSNLLRILELLWISSRGNLGPYMKSMGGVQPNTWNGESPFVSSMVKVSLPGEADQQNNMFTYELILTKGDQENQHRIYWERLSHVRGQETESKTDLFGGSTPDVDHSKMHLFDKDTVPADSSAAEGIFKKETLLSAYAGRLSGNSLIKFFQRHMSSWGVYLDVPFHRDAPVRQPSPATPDDRVAHDGGNLASVLHTLYSQDKNFKFEINSAMRAAFGNDFEELVFPPVANQGITLALRWRSLVREIPAPQISESVLRFLFLITILASPAPMPVIAVDEPETGLHPAAAALLAEYASAASSRSQILFTTHSPRLLAAFDKVKPSVARLSLDNGETVLYPLEGKDLTTWIRQYSPRGNVTPDQSVILDTMEIPVQDSETSPAEDAREQERSAILDTTLKVLEAEEIIQSEDLKPTQLDAGELEDLLSPGKSERQAFIDAGPLSIQPDTGTARPTTDSAKNPGVIVRTPLRSLENVIIRKEQVFKHLQIAEKQKAGGPESHDRKSGIDNQ